MAPAESAETPRLLFVTAPYLSPASCELIPANEAALREFRARFAVDQFVWPSIKGGPVAPANARAYADVLRAALSPNCHVVVFSATAGSFALLALGGRRDVATLTMVGLFPPPATLRALGLSITADAAMAAYNDHFRPDGAYGLMARTMPGASKGLLDRVVGAIRDQVNWAEYGKLQDSFAGLNLAAMGAQIAAPTLFLDVAPATVTPGSSEVFTRLVPDATVDRLGGLEFDLNESSLGAELVRKVVAFIERNSRR